MTRTPTDRTITQWEADICELGVKRISARALLRTFGAQRRGDNVVERIERWLAEREKPIHANGLRFVLQLNDTISLSHSRELQIGRLVEKEKTLMARFTTCIVPHLGLHPRAPEFRPAGSGYRLDYLCDDDAGDSVAVELKREDGERRAVEQILDYIRAMREDTRCKNPRGVIVTGRADRHTRRALEELRPGYHIDWYVYGLQGKLEDMLAPIALEKVAVSPRPL